MELGARRPVRVTDKFKLRNSSVEAKNQKRVDRDFTSLFPGSWLAAHGEMRNSQSSAKIPKMSDASGFLEGPGRSCPVLCFRKIVQISSCFVDKKMV